MNCGQARRYLLKYDSTDLKVIPHVRVAHHINCCPGCERMRGLFLKLSEDLKIGSELDSAKFELYKIDWKRPSAPIIPTGLSVLRKLDWWLMPELTLKWAVPVLGIIVLGFLSSNPIPSKSTGTVGFPNDLVISRGHVIVTMDPNSGLHLTNRSDGLNDQSRRISGSAISKGAI